MKKITKQMIIDNYKFRYADELNKRMRHDTFSKKEGWRYYLEPTFIDITDYFTGEEMYNNFCLEDIKIIDFNKYPNSDPKKCFGPDWTVDYGIVSRWTDDISGN